MNFKDKTVCIRDTGLFLPMARAYAKEFGTAYYSTPWEKQFPDGEALQIGDGYPELIRVDNIDSIMDEVDLWIFLDIGDGALQDRLRKAGKRVFGGGSEGENLELKRWLFRQTLKDLGLQVSPAKRVIGITALREHLMENDCQWVKISRFRGIEETFYSENYLVIFPFLDQLQSKLGARRELVEFLCEEPIDAVVETGYDGFCIDGEFPRQAFFGYERKNKSYAMVAKPYDELPEEVRKVNDALAPVLKKIGYRNSFHTELRVTEKGEVFFTDITCRPGSPPSEIFTEMITNLAEVAWFGAEGVLVEPKLAFEYGVQAVIESHFAERNAMTVIYPESIGDRVKMFNSCVDQTGLEWVTPLDGSSCEIGFVVGLGDTLKDAIEECMEVAGQVKGFRLKIDTDEVCNALKEIEKGEEEGLEFSEDPLPDPDDIQA